MTIHKLAELLDEYALANPTVRLRTVTLAEFSEWYSERKRLEVPVMPEHLARLIGWYNGNR